MVSHERIYQYIREDKQKGGSLYKHTRHRLKHRKRPVGGKKVIIPDKVSINQRPDIINNKERVGDWEIDTIVGAENKGANEYTNKLVRQYIPKKQTFKKIDENKIKKIQQKINRRPRKKLNFETPFKMIVKKIALVS